MTKPKAMVHHGDANVCTRDRGSQKLKTGSRPFAQMGSKDGKEDESYPMKRAEAEKRKCREKMLETKIRGE